MSGFSKFIFNALIAVVAICVTLYLALSALSSAYNRGETNEVRLWNETDLPVTSIVVTFGSETHEMHSVSAKNLGSLHRPAGPEGSVGIDYLLDGQAYKCSFGYITPSTSSRTVFRVTEGGAVKVHMSHQRQHPPAEAEFNNCGQSTD